MAYNFVVNGSNVDLYDGSQVILSVDSSTRPFTWAYDDAGRIRFTIAGNVYEVASYTDIQFEGVALTSLDDFGTQIATVFTGYAGSSPTEFLYVSSPVNKVFRLDGLYNSKASYATPEQDLFVFWITGDTWYIADAKGNDSTPYAYENSGADTTYPESGTWFVDGPGPSSISITRYHGTLQEVLEQISKPKEWPKVYRALLTQSGTDAPTVVELENTIGSIVWSYVNVGAYAATLASAFPQNKTFCLIGQRDGNAANSTQGNNYAYRVSDNEIQCTTAKNDDTYENGNLVYTPFEILVSP